MQGASVLKRACVASGLGFSVWGLEVGVSGFRSQPPLKLGSGVSGATPPFGGCPQRRTAGSVLMRACVVEWLDLEGRVQGAGFEIQRFLRKRAHEGRQQDAF